METLSVFFDTDMRLSFDGLIDLCKKNKLKIQEFDYGKLIVFVNTARTHIKILACNNSEAPVIGAYRMPHGRIYDLRVIQNIPKAFSGGRINFDEETRELLEDKFARKRNLVRLET
jgi:hypothetical protein